MDGEVGSGGANQEGDYDGGGIGTGGVRREGVGVGLGYSRSSIFVHDTLNTLVLIPFLFVKPIFIHKSLGVIVSRSSDRRVVRIRHLYRQQSRPLLPRSILHSFHLCLLSMRHAHEAQLPLCAVKALHSQLHAHLSWQLGLHVQPCGLLCGGWSALRSFTALSPQHIICRS